MGSWFGRNSADLPIDHSTGGGHYSLILHIVVACVLHFRILRLGGNEFLLK